MTLEPIGCPEVGKVCENEPLKHLITFTKWETTRFTAYHWEDCGIFCRNHPKCNFWDYNEKKNECLFFDECKIHKSAGKKMGRKNCPSKRNVHPGKFQTIFSSDIQ